MQILNRIKNTLLIRAITKYMEDLGQDPYLWSSKKSYAEYVVDYFFKQYNSKFVSVYEIDIEEITSCDGTRMYDVNIRIITKANHILKLNYLLVNDPI